MSDDARPLPAPALSDVVDVGSWARFTPSLALLLDEKVRPRHAPAAPREGATDTGSGARPGTESGAHAGVPDEALTVLLTAPAPVVTGFRTSTSWWGLRRQRLEASPDLPGMVLVGRGDGVEVDLPTLDARGRLLLDADARAELTSLGWSEREDLLTRVLPDGATAAEAITRVLIEVLRVPHPADLDALITPA